jgi:putative modified peptide
MTKLSPDVADKLLHGLSTDDNFRAAFEKDPRAALRSLGHETPAEHVGVAGKDPVMNFATLKGGLASKQKIASARQQLAGDPNASVSSFMPFSMCAAD